MLGKTKMSGLDYEKKNFENMILFYSKQLRRIMRGSSAYYVLSARERRNLLGAGILQISYDGKKIKNKKRIVLTLRAEKTLRKMPKE
jgi:hypothetical protein